MEPIRQNQTETLTIDGMSCAHCVASVRSALESVPGVVVRDVQIGSATVDMDPERASPDALAEAIEEAGFDVVEA